MIARTAAVYLTVAAMRRYRQFTALGRTTGLSASFQFVDSAANDRFRFWGISIRLNDRFAEIVQRCRADLSLSASVLRQCSLRQHQAAESATYPFTTHAAKVSYRRS